MSIRVKVLQGVWDSLNFEGAVCQDWFKLVQVLKRVIESFYLK